MAKLLLLDFESTGLNLKTDRITEYCFHEWDTVTDACSEETGYMWDPRYPEITPEIEKLTRISEATLFTEGERPAFVLERLASRAMQMDFFVAHGAYRFDKPLLEEECRRHEVVFPKVKWVDTRSDLPYRDRLKCRVLTHLALEHGFPVDMSKAHGAPYDVQMMKHILKQFDLPPILELCSQPLVIAQAQTTYETREKAKSKGYSWEKIDDFYYPKTWIKVMRLSQFTAEAEMMGAQGVSLKMYTIEE